MGYEWWHGLFAVLALTGVTVDEVLQTLNAERRWPRRGVDPVTGVTALTIWGRTDAGRPLIVTLRQLNDRDYQIVAARPMTDEQATQFTRWEEAQ